MGNRGVHLCERFGKNFIGLYVCDVGYTYLRRRIVICLSHDAIADRVFLQTVVVLSFELLKCYIKNVLGGRQVFEGETFQ